MGWDGAGNVVRTDGTRTGRNIWRRSELAGSNIRAADADAHANDLAEALENCIARDGQNAPTVNLPMGGHKHTGVGEGTHNAQYFRAGDLSDTDVQAYYIEGDDVSSGSGDLITLRQPIYHPADEAGIGYSFFAKHTNTGAVQLKVGDRAAVALVRNDLSAFELADITPGRHLLVRYDETNDRYIAVYGAGVLRHISTANALGAYALALVDEHPSGGIADPMNMLLDDGDTLQAESFSSAGDATTSIPQNSGETWRVVSSGRTQLGPGSFYPVYNLILRNA